jgi:hypothetical protein
LRANEDVEKFLLCSTKPDPTKESELTTFITMYRESKQLQSLQIKEELGTKCCVSNRVHLVLRVLGSRDLLVDNYFAS